MKRTSNISIILILVTIITILFSCSDNNISNQQNDNSCINCFGVNALQWSHSSQPIDEMKWISCEESSNFRGKLFWFQFFIPRTPIRDIYPDIDVPYGHTNLNPLYIYFDTDIRGIYNKNPKFLDSINLFYNPLADLSFSKNTNNRENIWGGMMRMLSSENINIDDEGLEYFEIMMRLNYYEPGLTKMFIDLGQISEDIIPNQILNTEDGTTKAKPLLNNLLDDGEDIGIDALNNKSEKDTSNYPFPLNLEEDPARDDYFFIYLKEDLERVRFDFQKYNNYEGNSKSHEIGKYPDTEILDKKNGQSLSILNSYFEYEVNLAPNPPTNTQIVGGNPNKAWFLYRIPLKTPIKEIGNPSFSKIKYIRVWFCGGGIGLEIADWRLITKQDTSGVHINY
jgi:cell surface protein SprA